MPRISHIFLLLLFLQTNAFTQREYGVCDSTSYPLNADTTIVAGRHMLYMHTPDTMQTLHDFTSPDPDEYIRDFDVITPDLWYTVIGSRYIGGPTRLYKSLDQGQSWTIDTAHHAAANAASVSDAFLRSINNLQHLNGDTLLLFMHYYESGILYSTDLGQSWTKWFNNLIAHYQGMFECDHHYYLYGYEGDGFRASMFAFDKSLLFSPDSTGLWNSFNNLGYHPPCYNGDTVHCIYPPFSASRCESYTFFKNTIDSLCMTLGLADNSFTAYRIYPNPFHHTIHIEGVSGAEIYRLANMFGQTVWSGSQIALHDFSGLAPGVYFLTIVQEKASMTVTLLRH